jgi:hypothetical protein
MTRDIKVSIDKIKIKYPTISIIIYMEPSKIEIVFSINEEN